MAYQDSFVETIQQYGGALDPSILPEPGEIYDTVIRFCEWWDQLDDGNKGAYAIAWSCGLTAGIFDEVVGADRWLLDAVDEIPDIEDAVNTAREAIAKAAEADDGS